MAENPLAAKQTQVSEAIVAADKLLSEHRALALDTSQTIAQAIMQADLIAQLEAALTDNIMQRLLALKDTNLGFRTDEAAREKKGSQPYSVAVIRRCMVEAALKGAAIINNEFNIIGGNVYLTKGFFGRKLRDLPGLSELRLDYGFPKFATGGGGALVDVKASWKLNGQPDSLDCTGGQAIAVRLNEGQGADAAIGKAERKAKARILGRITGTLHDDGEVDETDLRPVAGRVVEPAAPAPAAPQTKVEVLKERLKAEPPAPPAGSLPQMVVDAHQEAGIPTTLAAVPAPAPAPVAEAPKEKAKAKKNGKKGEPEAPAQATPAQEQKQEPAQLMATPSADPEPELEETNAGIGNAKSREWGKAPKRTFAYIIVDARSAEYTTNSLEAAQAARECKEKGVKAKIQYRDYGNGLYWVVSITPLSEQAETGPVANSGDAMTAITTRPGPQ
jgi:hypothetical protein